MAMSTENDPKATDPNNPANEPPEGQEEPVNNTREETSEDEVKKDASFDGDDAEMNEDVKIEVAKEKESIELRQIKAAIRFIAMHAISPSTFEDFKRLFPSIANVQ
jgi:hypothetical protein